MKVIDFGPKEEDKFFIRVWIKGGEFCDYHDAQGIDFEFDAKSYAVIDKYGGMHVFMHNSLDGLHVTKERHGTTD